MRHEFRDYYFRSEAELGQLWDQCTFVLDASVLLDLYRVSPRTRCEFLDVLRRLKDRLWLPHQAGLEFHRNRLNVIDELGRQSDKLKAELDQTRSRLLSLVSGYKRYAIGHDDTLSTRINDTFSDLANLHEAAKSEQEEAFGEGFQATDDTVLDELTQIYTDRVGPSYDPETLSDLRTKGEGRYTQKRPPGFMDQSKPEDRRYGDFIMWRQIVDHSVDTGRPVVLVIEDRKEDWWRIHRGRRIGPRLELIEELRECADVEFHMYRGERFLYWAKERTKDIVSDEAIDDWRRIDNHRARWWHASQLSVGDLFPEFSVPDFSDVRLQEFLRHLSADAENKLIAAAMAGLSRPSPEDFLRMAGIIGRLDLGSGGGATEDEISDDALGPESDPNDNDE